MTWDSFDCKWCIIFFLYSYTVHCAVCRSKFTFLGHDAIYSSAPVHIRQHSSVTISIRFSLVYFSISFFKQVGGEDWEPFRYLSPVRNHISVYNAPAAAAVVSSPPEMSSRVVRNCIFYSFILWFISLPLFLGSAWQQQTAANKKKENSGEL